MATTPGLPGAIVGKQQPDFLVREIADLKRDLRELRQALGALTGMTFVNGAISSKTFDGDLAAPAAGNNGFALGGPHDTLIVNDILLKGEIIGDDALVNPVSTDVYNQPTTGRGASSSYFVYISGSIAVPSGFSRAVVMAAGYCQALANGGGGFYVETKIKIGGVDGPECSQWTAAGTASSAPASNAQLVTGLSGGGSVSVQMVALQTTVANVVANSIQGGLSAVALFLR
jgi:hypothetical protein